MDRSVVATLAGAWQLERRLYDRDGDAYGRVRGQLIVTEEEAAVHWREEGRLSWKGREYPVHRHTVLRENDDGQWWMFFQDGRPFHPWRPGEFVVHPCGADLYRGIVAIDEPNRLRTLWDVTGPETAQRIYTRFRRR